MTFARYQLTIEVCSVQVKRHIASLTTCEDVIGFRCDCDDGFASNASKFT